MIEIIQKEFKDLSNFFEVIEVNQKNNYVLVFNINKFLNNYNEGSFVTKSITVRLLLPKTIIFDPIQNDHIIINPFIISENYLLSWKIHCLNLPCQLTAIKLEISF